MRLPASACFFGAGRPSPAVPPAGGFRLGADVLSRCESTCTGRRWRSMSRPWWRLRERRLTVAVIHRGLICRNCVTHCNRLNAWN